MRLLSLALAAALLLACRPGLAAGQTVRYLIDNQPFEGYYQAPHPHAPLLVLVHDWDGLTDYERQRADMLAQLGYRVFALDLFGEGIRPTAEADKRRLTGALYADRTLLRHRLQAGVAAAEAQGDSPTPRVLLGYCFGGAAVLEAARSGLPAQGFVSFHGGLATPPGQDYRQTRGSVLVFHGSADDAVPLTDFAELASRLEQAGVPHEMTTYSGAPHAFSVFGSPRYHAEADRKSWQRFTAYLQETLPLSAVR
ncbi:dienelactone hydrolase family protein [Pseudaeromonas sp. ZJS20]|uniref:dienelactone hydrolase family protein n=1 Tax=Pseudaeromonas aegiceratis TaxID=3153928 RepID=UPI00390C9D95